MLTITKFNNYKAVLFLTLAGMAFYRPLFAQTADAQQGHEGHHQEGKKLDWPGVYQGFTPCADCAGVKTSLALNSNNSSYQLITMFAGKSEREYVEKGKYELSDKNNVILLTPKNGGKPHYYQIGENSLTQLDDKGNAFTGKGAERYVLRRIDVTEAGPKHAH